MTLSLGRVIGFVALGLTTLLVTLIALLASGLIEADVQRWRQPLANTLTQALGREVLIQGNLQLKLSFRPELTAQTVTIRNPADFEAPDFATINTLRLNTELLPLLRRHLVVRELHGQGVSFHLDRSVQGRGNWIFEPAPKPAGEARQPRFRIDWQRVVAEDALIQYAGETMDSVVGLRLDSVVLEGLTGRPLQLTAEGKSGPAKAESDTPPGLRIEANSAALAELGRPEPWSFAASLQTPGSAASISGTRQKTGEGLIVRIKLQANAKDLDEIASLLDVTAPLHGPAELSGEFEFVQDTVLIRNIEGRLDDVPFSGQLEIDQSGPKPQISGHIDIPEVDVGEKLAAGVLQRDQPTEHPATLAAAYNAFKEADLQLGELAEWDSDFTVSVGHLVGSPGDLRDVKVRLQLQSGKLNAPFTATLGGAAIEGEINADGSASTPRLGLRFVAQDAPFGGLARLMFDMPHVAGNVHRYSAEFSASGQTGLELLRDLEGKITIEEAKVSYGNYLGGRPVELHIANAAFEQPRGQAISASINGHLRGRPLQGTLQTDSLEQILQQRSSAFKLQARSGGIRLQVSGRLAEPAAEDGPDVDIKLSAPQARELAPWLGFAAHSVAAVNLDGNIRIRESGAVAVSGSLQFGRSSIKGDFDWQNVAGKNRLVADVVAGVIAPLELGGLREPTAAGRDRNLIDIPILPEVLDLGDAELDITVQRIEGTPLDITNLSFKGTMRDGAIAASPLSLNLQGNPLQGTLQLDMRSALPEASLQLEGKDFDAGVVLQQLRVAEDIESNIKRLQLSTTIRGSKLGEALEHSVFEANLEAGSLAFRDQGTRAALRLELDKGMLSAGAGGALLGSISGTARGQPVQIEFEAASLRDLVSPTAAWPFSLSARLPGSGWNLSGNVAPARDPKSVLMFSLHGEKLSGLDTLLSTSLPAWGPYDLAGELSFTPNGYQLGEAQLSIGNSQLLGWGVLNTHSSPPSLQLELSAPVLQLDDFSLADWSPVDLPKSSERLSARAAGRAFTGGVRSVHPLVSRERLALAEAQIDIDIERLAAGTDELGRARLSASIFDGTATLGPIELEGNAGNGQVIVSYTPRENNSIFHMRADLQRINYGLVTTRMDAESSMAGTFDLDLALDSITPDLDQVLQHGSGHLNLVIWPELLRWGRFDLWTANLLRSLLPIVDSASSHINCLIGEFDLRQGELSSRSLIVDTTNTRAAGWLLANFATERLHLRLVPRHKRVRLFSFAVPIEVRGSFRDYRIVLRPTDAAARVGQWFKALAMVPLGWFGVGRIPGDGRDICLLTAPQS